MVWNDRPKKIVQQKSSFRIVIDRLQQQLNFRAETSCEYTMKMFVLLTKIVLREAASRKSYSYDKVIRKISSKYTVNVLSKMTNDAERKRT
jgi:hypothetical protein